MSLHQLGENDTSLMNSQNQWCWFGWLPSCDTHTSCNDSNSLMCRKIMHVGKAGIEASIQMKPTGNLLSMQQQHTTEIKNQKWWWLMVVVQNWCTPGALAVARQWSKCCLQAFGSEWKKEDAQVARTCSPNVLLGWFIQLVTHQEEGTSGKPTWAKKVNCPDNLSCRKVSINHIG